MSDIDKFLDEPVSDTPAKTSAVDSFMEDAPDTAKGFGGALRDTAVAAGSGAVTGIQLLANAAGAGNAVSQKLGDAADYVRGFETEARREERAARAEKIKKAEASGSTWEEVKANVGAFAEAPIDTTVEALGTSLPTIAATALTRGKLRAPVAGAMGAAQGAGTVKGAIYDAVKQQHLDAGATPEEAEARAVEAQAYGGDNAGQIALGAGLGVAAGTTGVEGVVGRMLGNEAGEAAAQGVIRSTLLGAAKEAPLEAAQGGQERLASNIALQNEGFDTPTWQGVAGQAALEGLAGAAAGGGFGAVEGAFAHDSQSAPVVDPTELAGDEPAADPAPAADPVAEPQAPTAEPLAAGMAPGQVQPQYRTERPFPARPSEQMGLDPAAGALSDAAATAVDTGASAQLAQQAAEQQAAELAQKEAKKGAKAGEQIDTNTGEIIQSAPDRTEELTTLISYIEQQARISGWDNKLIQAHDEARAELDALDTPAGKAKQAARQVLSQGGTEADASRAATDSLIADMGKSPEISISAEAPAAVEAAKQEVSQPTPLQQGIAKVRAEKVQAKPQDHPAVSGWLASRLSDFKQRNQIPDGADIEQAIAENEASPNMARAGRAGKLRAELNDIEKSLGAARQWLNENPDQAAALEADARLDFADPVSTLNYRKTGERPRSMVDDAMAPADIKAITAKQIPQMTDAEIAQAIDRYGPDHKRTAKLQKEQAKRATQGTENVPQAAQAVEASPQSAQVGGQAPTADAEAAGTTAAGSPAGVDHGARWEAMSRDERQALAEKSGVKPVFAKSLPGAPWDRIGEATQQKLAAAMAAEPAVKDPHIERMQENKRLLARPSRELVAQAEAMGIHDADQHSNVESLEARMKARQEHESRDTGGGWYAFHPGSGTVGIPRAEMPQIKAEHRGAMVNFLNARGVQHQESTVPASALRPTQAEFSRDKVAKARDFEGGNRSILISQDGHVLDGHHQWLAAREKGEDVKVISLGAPIRELVKLAHEFPSSTTDSSSEAAPASVKTQAPVTAQTPEQVDERKADEYAAHLRKLGDEFQGSYKGRSLAPLARAMADHAIEQGRRLSDAEITDLGKRFDVPADVVEQLTGNIFTFDALLGAAQRREPGAVALRKRQGQAGGAESAAVGERKKKTDEYGAKNKLVTADRAAELRSKLAAKLNGSQLNSGLDPEILAMGTELAIFHLEASARRFAEFARLMADDLGQPLEKIRPYLRGWYNGARDNMEDQGVSIEGMDNPDEVRKALAELDAAPAAAEAPAQESDAERVARIKATPPEERTDADLDWYVEYRQRNRGQASADQEAAEAAAKAAATSPSLDNYVKDMAPNVAALAIKALNKQIRIDGKAATLREHIEAWHAAGELSVSTSQEPRIKPMSRRDFNRATEAEQRMHEKRMQQAGSKTVYYVNDYDLGKTAHDYAAALVRDELEPAAAGAVANVANGATGATGATGASADAEPATPAARFEQLRSEGHGEMPEVIAFAKVAGATGEKPADVYNRWQSVMGFMAEVEKGTGKDLASLMGRALVKEPYKVDTAYPGSNPPAVSDLASAQRFAERTAKALESFNRDMALYDARTFDAERFGIDEALVKTARDAIQQMRQTAAANERAAEQLVKDAEAKEKADAEAEAQAKRDGYEAADLRELSVKPTAAKVTNWMTGTFQGQTVYSASGHLIDLSGSEPHLKGWAERMDRLRTTINENAVANVVAGSNAGRAAVKLEPLAINDRPDLKDSKQAVFSRKEGEPAVYLNLNYVRYFLSKFKGAEFFAGEPNSRGDYSALQVRLNGELVGILSPISMKEDTRTPAEIRGYMQASGKAEVKPKSVVERAKEVKAESGAAAARFQVVAINERTGAKEYLSFGEPMTQDQAIKFKKRFSEHPARRIQLEAVTDTPAAKPESKRSVMEKAAEAKAQAVADYFAPGNVVPSYGGNFDRVVSYQAPDKDGHWSVTVRAVVKQDGEWIDKPGERERNHSTLPEARELKAGPAGKVEPVEADAAPQMWHTELPQEGIALTKEQREGKADAYRAISGMLATDAVNAITPVQLTNQTPLYLYVLPEASGRNGIARFVPDDQTVPAPWKKADDKPLSYALTREQMIYRTTEALRNQPVLGSVTRATGAGAERPGSRRDPRVVSMLNPYLEGDVVSIDGQDWTVRQDMPGWYLTNTGNWRGQHPTIHGIKDMADLIREVEQAATAQPADAAQDDAAADFPLKEAADSYSGISHSGSARAKADAEEYARYIDDARESGLAVAHTDAQKAAVAQAVADLRVEYLANYRRLMSVRAGTYSGHVAGRSGLNGKQANQRNNAYDRAIETFTAWQSANTHKARKAALDARTEAEKAADQAAADQAREDKAQKERDADLTLMRKILSWKKGGEPVAITKTAVLDGVNKGRDGYPTSIKLKPIDGSTLLDDKFDLAALFRDRKRGESVPESKRRVRELVNAVRAEAATEAAQEAQDQEQAPTKADSKMPLLQAHEDAMEQARDGKIEAEAFRAAFAQVEGNREVILAELNSMNKEKLLRAGGVHFYHRYKSEKKDRVVEALYRSMLDEYALGKSYGPTSYMMTAAGMESHRQAKAQALRDLVAGTDADALSQYAAEVAELRKERESRKEATQKALTDPQTLAEFRSAITYNAERHAETRREAYLRLTPEQRRRYDALEAESTREARDQAKAKQRTKIASAGNTTAGEVIATKHTKHGHDLFVVKLEERVSRDDYDTLNSSAKRMGGSYSSYRGNGAIPGFQFRTREAAEAFRKLVAGDTTAAQEVAQARRDAFEDDRSQSAVERLRTMAAALNERAEEELGRDRKVNTARRARMASAAEGAANANKALAGTMSNIADAIESGKAKFLDLVRQKVQVEFLNAELRNAKDAQIRAKYPSYADQERHRGQPIDDETVDYSAFPTYGGMRSDLAGIARQMIEVDGLKNLGQRLLKVADDVSDAYVEWAKNNLLSVSRFGRGDQLAEFASRDDAERAIRRANLSDRAIVLPLKRGVNRIVLSPSEAMKQGVWQGDDKRIDLSGDFGREIVEAVGRRAGSKIKLPWQLETVHAKRKRLEGMGIYTGSEYRAALREFAELQQAMATPDKIKQMERAMIGRRSDGLDFFPTSEAVVDAMLEAAEIAEGMGVLEPSAGMGHIADAIREKTGVEPDVVELSGERRELLQAKGYHLAGDDFMAMQPRTFYTFGDIFQAPDGTKGIMHGGAAWSGRASLHAINEDGSEGKMLGWYDRDELTGIEQRGSWSGYDRIVMNPPFSKGRDIQHVQHAYSLLKPGGRLVAIMGEGAFFQSNSAAEGFRAWLDDLGATSERLPENSFMDAALPVNTAVNARMVVIDKPATDTSGITADSARRAAVRARVAANNDNRADEDFLQGMLKALYEKTGDGVLEHKLSTWLDSRFQRLEAVDQLYAEYDKAFAGKDEVLFSRQSPVETAGLSQSSVVTGKAPANPLTLDEAIAAAERFLADYNGHIELSYRIRKTQDELYGPGSIAKIGVVKGAYHPGRGLFTLTADHLSSVADTVETLRHELLGHYGLDTFAPADKQALLDKILASKDDPTLKVVWSEISRLYSDKSDSVQAEEVFARLAEGERSGKEKLADLLYSLLTRLLRKVFGYKKGIITRRELLREIEVISKGIRNGSRPRQTFDSEAKQRRGAQTDTEAFRRWFGKSKVVGADGQPLNLYHGTAADFTVFDQGRAGSATGHATSALGIFMSSDRRAAQNYAEKASDGMPGYGRVMDLYASIQNPYLMSVEESQEVESPLEARRLRTRLEQQGYDGIRLKGTPVWIAFNNYQVKSATDNNGDFDEFDPDIRFSRSAVRDFASRATQELNRTFSAPGGLSWWHKTVGTMYNLAQRSPHFKPVFEAAQGFIDDVSHYASDAAELAPKLLPKLETWRDIAKSPVQAKDNKAISAPIFEGTLMWARDEDGKPVRVDSLAERAMGLTAEQKADILVKQGKLSASMLAAWRGQGAEQFAKMVDSRYETQSLKPGIVWTDAELRSMWHLTDGQIELYREFRGATNRSLDTMARADMLRFGGEDVKGLREQVMDAADVKEAGLILRDHLAQLADAQPERAMSLLDTAQGINERVERITQLQAEGYAPLSRFGKYTVDMVGADGERQYFSLFETKREANLMAEQMKAAFPGSTISQGTLSEEAFKLFAGITPETLELFGNAMGLDSSGDSERDKVFQDYLKLTKTNRSAMKRLIHRQGIAGYSEDVGRVLASFVYSNARQTAAGLNMGDLSEAVNAIPQGQGELKDAAVRLADYIKNPQEEAQALRGLLFAQYLGGSVASAFVNMTQPVAVTFPWLSQYGGAKQAAGELSKAAKQMATKGYRYEADLAKALHLAEEDGTVSPQEVHQLMAQASGTGGLRAGDGTRAGDARALASNSLARLSLAWGKMFGAAEEVNRRMTFIAAYRIAKAQGNADPAAFARLAVRETQFIYSKASKMRWGRGAVGSTLMTFKTYSVAYLELMGRLWNQGEAGSQERKDGRKAALLMIATLMLLGGAGGLPFAEDAEDLIDGMAQLAGYNFSTQKAKEQFLIDVFGDDIARFIDKGVTGLPGAPLDVSGRLGMGNLIPGTGLLQQRDDHSRDVLEIAGPAGDLVKRMISGAHKAASGDLAGGLLEVSPTAVRNLAKGADMAATDMYRDDKGYKVLDTNTLEAALKAVGFQPQSVASIQEANWLGQRSKAFYNMRAQEIRALWAQGVFEKDPAKVQDARAAVADWNAKNPDQPMRISVPDVMRRVREMGKSKDQRIADTAPRAMRQQLREDFARVRATIEE